MELITFFGSLSSEIMQYLGMMDENDTIIIPDLQDIDIKINKRRISESIVCDDYFFDMNEQ